MRSIQVLRQNRSYLWFTFGVFLLGCLVGALFPMQIGHMTHSALQNLQEVAAKTQQKHSGLYTSFVIFTNNLRATVTMLLAGLPFGILTFLELLINGAVVGVVFREVGAHSVKQTIEAIVFGLLPHGIFELPAIFIMGAFGLKVGRILFVPLPNMTRGQSYRHVWREVWSICPLVLVLLVVAAGVEGNVTPLLLKAFLVKAGS